MKKDFFILLRKIEKNPFVTQREIALELNISLGKINYCLKALKQKGLIKISNFNKAKNKTKYLYILTPKGIKQKSNATIYFLKEKIKEYEDLAKDIGIQN
jgi:EPS-associated MarR family transcriptional regulator